MDNNQDKLQGGITNNFYGNIHNYNVINGNATFNNICEKTNDQQVKYTDNQVARALANIVGKGKAIDSKQKWAGAMWYLHWVCNYPAKALAFCAKIATLSLPDNIEYACDYNNIRSLATLSFLNEDPRDLEKVKYSNNDQQAFFQLRSVVIALAEELEKTKPIEVEF